MKRGEIYWAQLDPTQGAEMKKLRPVLIISNNIANRFSSLITILPITSNTEKVHPFEVFIPAGEGREKNSKVCCQQIRTISKERLQKERLSQISKTQLQQVENALIKHLGI